MRVAIVLAAGSSRRFGRAAKLLALLEGKALLHHAIDRARASGARRVLVVTGAERGRIDRAVRRAGLPPLFARAHRAGMGASLATALRAVRPIEREVVIFLGDMPFAEASRKWRLGPGIDALRPIHCAVPGHPLLVRTSVARKLVMIGDDGLAGALRKSRMPLVQGAMGNVRDVDDRAALGRLRWPTPRR